MENHLVDFDKIAWVESAIGIRHKSFKRMENNKVD